MEKKKFQSPADVAAAETQREEDADDDDGDRRAPRSPTTAGKLRET